MNGKAFAIRQLSPSDQHFLWEMLYQSLYVPEGGTAVPREILTRLEIAKYAEGWGRKGDLGFVAVDLGNREPVGAAWLRLLAGNEKGYGYIGDQTPELGIAVLPKYRGQGLGSALLGRLLEAAGAEYQSVSLSVSVDNPAVRLYERAGFQRVGMSGESVTMVRSLVT